MPGFLLVLVCKEVWDSRGPDPDKQYLLGRKSVCRTLSFVCPTHEGGKYLVVAYLATPCSATCLPGAPLSLSFGSVVTMGVPIHMVSGLNGRTK